MPSVKKSPAKRSSAKKSPAKRSSAKKSPAKRSSTPKSSPKKTSYKNTKIAAGVAAALALAGAAGYGAYKVKQRRDLQKEHGMQHDSIKSYAGVTVQRMIATIKARAAALKASIMSRFQKKQITAEKANKELQETGKAEEKAIQQVVAQAQQDGSLPEHGL